jgi:UDP-N-acetylmuramoyl-L-alanyl-D-glutamate--2,6-diaminopimelate ligase
MYGMGVQLSQVADHIDGVIDVLGPPVAVSDITHDSRQAGPGTLFVAVRGEFHDGHRFVVDAIQRGASALLVESRQDIDVPQIVVSDTRSAMAAAARAVFESPDESLAIAGVTGTNGKTTVTHMLESILGVAGIPVGVIGTLGARIGDDPIPTARTTPEATDLQRILATMRDSGCSAVLMEVSSHAIELHRTDAIGFAVVGFTNISQDHLDFHGDMESYFDVKKRIFDPQVARRGVVNIDDPWGERLVSECQLESTLVSVRGDADVGATRIVGSAEGTSFDLVSSGGSAPVSLPLVGDFNLSNALVAAAMASELGVGLDVIATGLSEVGPISGRMEVIAHSGPFTVIVDYAHTPDAISAVLTSLQPITSGRVVAVLGAGGDRDKHKRAIMGAAAGRLSDLTIITTDNPRSEDPVTIAREVRRGAIAQPSANVQMIVDRREAIRSAISGADDGDVVVILGRGHEQGQDIGTEVLPFDDRAVSREALRRNGWEPS